MITKEKITPDIIEKTNAIKLFLYKNYPNILEKMDFENDEAFSNPLLFAFLRHKVINTFSQEIEYDLLDELLQGYYNELISYKIDLLYNFEGIAYIPNVGYFKKGEEKIFSPIVKLGNSSIEVLRCTSPVLKVILDDVPRKDLKWDEKLYKNNIKYLTNAMEFIKENVPKQFELIEECCRYIYLFNTPTENTNSFASGNALGAVFFNIYQPEYDEVFFVDDIAHQTGHVILNNIIFNLKSFYKINQKQMIEDILGKKDHRDINVLIHALYTYYTTFLCLDSCLKAGCFNEIQEKEAIARIAFYLRKCYYDLNLLDSVIKHFDGIENMLTTKGIEIITLIQKMFSDMRVKWAKKTVEIDFSNQDYNFSFKKYLEINN